MVWKRGSRIQLVDSGLEGTILKEIEGGSPEYIRYRRQYKERYGIYPEETGRISGSWTAPFYLVRIHESGSSKGRIELISEDEIMDSEIREDPSSSKVTRDPTREELEDIQDKLFMEHPEKLDTLYGHLRRATGKEPSPALVVNRFKDEYPELYQSVIGR